MRKRLFLFAALIGITLPMMAAIELSKSNPTYEQNFDGTATEAVLAVDEAKLAAADANKRSVSLAVDLPEGWKIRNGSSTSAIGVYATGADATTYVGGTSLPSNAKNGTWNLGKIAATDRAIGGITSSTSGGAQSINILCQITNTEAEAITSLDLSYAIEQYRKGIKGYKMTLYTSTTGEGSSWTAVDDAFSLIFNNTVGTATGAADDALPISTKSVEDQKLVVTIASSESLYLAWHIAAADGTEAGGAAALALDDVTITANYGEVTPGPEPEPEPATPIASGELFGTYQAIGAAYYNSQSEKPNLEANNGRTIDIYVVSLGNTVLAKTKISSGGFWPDGGAAQLRIWNNEQTGFSSANLNGMPTAGGDQPQRYTASADMQNTSLKGKAETITMTLWAKAWIDGKAEHSSDFFSFNRSSINNPITDAVAPVLDVENTTFVDNGDGTITVTFGTVAADDEYFYYVADKDHNLGDISLDNTITLTKPTVQDGITYTLKAYAVDFNGNKSDAKEYSFTMPFDEGLNLAENRPSYCGYQQQAGTGAEKANNTDLSDFWTCYGGPVADAWWKVDLLDTYDLTYIEMLWNDATGTYSILGSTDDINWASIVSGKAAPASKGGTSTDDITVSARYIKMQFSSSNIGLKNVIIRGTGIAAADHTAPTLSLSEVSKTVTTATIGLEYADLDDNGGAGQIVSIKISDTENGFAEREILSEISDGKITLSGLKDNTTYTFHVVVTDKAGNQASDDIEVVLPFNTELNLAKNKPSTANATQGANTAKKANDGINDNAGNYWTSYGESLPDGDTYFYWQVDLEELYAISRVNIIFHDVAGTYNILYGADGEEWHTYEGDFKVEHQGDSHEFAKAVTARYFRFTSTSANVGIREFEVYGTGFAGADSKAPVVSANEVAASATTNSVKLHIEASDLNDNDEPQPMPRITISGNYGFTTIENAVLDAEGNITLTDLIKNKRAYTFKVTATDLAGNKSTEQSVRVELPFDPTYDMGQNVEDKSSAPSQVWAGATETGHAAINAVRDNGKYWGNYPAAPSVEDNWWTIDLSVICEINYINIDFQTARKFDLLATFDNKDAVDAGTATWFTVAENLTNADYENVAPNFAARCIRIQSRSAEYMSISRVVIKADGRATTDAVAPQVTVTEVSKTENTATLKIVATDEDDAHVAHPVKSITISGDNDFETIENALLDGEGNITLNGLKDNATYNFHVTVTDRVGLTAEQDIEVRVAFNTTTNLAPAGSATAGCEQAENTANKAIDNNEGSYWGTYGCGNWETSNVLTIDLGTSYNIASVVIKTGGMEGASQDFVLEYQPSAPMGAAARAAGAWVEIGSADGVAQNSQVTIPVVVTAQTIRLRATQKHMVAIKEFEVYGSGYDDPDTEKPSISAAALVGEVGEDEATVAVTATDNVGVYACRFTSGEFSKVIDLVAGQCHLTGLVPGTTYTFSVVALDRAGNESNPFVMTSFSTTANDNVPHTAAPVPTIPAARVTSIYSDAYASAVKDGFQWRAYNSTATTEAKVIAGDNYMHYACGAGGEFAIGANFKDVTKPSTDDQDVGINISTRAALHVDVWSKEAYGEGIGITLNDNRLLLGYKLQAGWNSINVSLAELKDKQDGGIVSAASVLESLKWMKFTEITNKVIAIDNIYFYGVGISETASNDAVMEQYDTQEVDVVLNRGFETGKLYTFCVPFSMDADQIEEAFGTDAQVWMMTGSEDRGSLIHIDFALQSEIVAGNPYLLRPRKDFAAGTTIEGVTISNTNGETLGEDGAIQMHGYVNKSDFTADQHAYFLLNDEYLHELQLEGIITYNGLRAYFTFTTAPAAGTRARIRLGETVTTDIETLDGAANIELQKVLMNGNIYIIRDGRMYNVQGLLVK